MVRGKRRRKRSDRERITEAIRLAVAVLAMLVLPTGAVVTSEGTCHAPTETP
jgi:hypothetical protein